MKFYLLAFLLIIWAVIFSKYKADDYAYEFKESGKNIEDILKYSLRD